MGQDCGAASRFDMAECGDSVPGAVEAIKGEREAGAIETKYKSQTGWTITYFLYIARCHSFVLSTDTVIVQVFSAEAREKYCGDTKPLVRTEHVRKRTSNSGASMLRDIYTSQDTHISDSQVWISHVLLQHTGIYAYTS